MGQCPEISADSGDLIKNHQGGANEAVRNSHVLIRTAFFVESVNLTGPLVMVPF